jgi:hypothetical protein
MTWEKHLPTPILWSFQSTSRNLLKSISPGKDSGSEAGMTIKIFNQHSYLDFEATYFMLPSKLNNQNTR